MSDQHVPDSARSTPLNRRWWGAAVLALAVVVRLAYLTQLRGSILFEQPQGDAGLHYAMAREIAGGDWRGQRVFYLAPLYPYFVAAIFSMVGSSVLAVALVQVALSTLQVWIIMTIGRKLFGPTVGTTAGGMAACYGPFVFYTGFLLKETLGLVLLDAFVLSALWLVGRQDRFCRTDFQSVDTRDGLEVRPTTNFKVGDPLVLRGRWWWSILPGLLIGLASLVRPNLLPLVAVVAAWLWIESRGVPWLNRASAVLLFALGASIAVLPVAWRNYVVGKEWVLISAHGGHNFFIGNRPGASGLYEPLRAGGGQSPEEEERDARAIAEQATGKSLRASEVSAYWYARGWREIRKDPGNFVRVTLRKLALFWNDYEVPDVQDFYFLRRECPVLWLAPLTLGLVAPLAGWGLVAGRDRWRSCLLLYVLIIGVVVSVIPFFVFARYRLPVVPVVLVFAAVGATSIGRQIAARDWVSLRPACAIVVALAVVVNWRIYDPIGSGHLATSYFNIGNLYRAAGRAEQAVAAWEEAVRLNPDYRKPHRALGEAYFEAGRFAEAAQFLSKGSAYAAADLPADSDLAFMLGMSYMKSGQFDAAERVFRHSRKAWPTDRRFVDALAELAEKQPGATRE